MPLLLDDDVEAERVVVADVVVAGRVVAEAARVVVVAVRVAEFVAADCAWACCTL